MGPKGAAEVVSEKAGQDESGEGEVLAAAAVSQAQCAPLERRPLR